MLTETSTTSPLVVSSEGKLDPSQCAKGKLTLIPLSKQNRRTNITLPVSATWCGWRREILRAGRYCRRRLQFATSSRRCVWHSCRGVFRDQLCDHAAVGERDRLRLNGAACPVGDLAGRAHARASPIFRRAPNDGGAFPMFHTAHEATTLLLGGRFSPGVSH